MRRTENMMKTVESDMMLLGIPMHMNGFKYLREAVAIILEDEDCIRSMSKNVYPVIAMNWCVTPGSVEVSMRRAIDVAWSMPSGCMRKKLYRYSSGILDSRPTVSQFISLLSWKARQEEEHAFVLPPMEPPRHPVAGRMYM